MQVANYRNIATNLAAGAFTLMFPNGVIDNGKVLNAGVNATNNDTVTINGKVYTFKTALTPSAGEVLIGAAALDTMFNLYSAVMLLAGAGTLYASATTAPTDFYAEKPLATGTVMTFRPLAANGTLTVAEGMTNAANVWQEGWNVFLGAGRVESITVSCPPLDTLSAALDVVVYDALVDSSGARQRGGDGATRPYLAKMVAALTATRGTNGDPWINTAVTSLPSDLTGVRAVWGPTRMNQSGLDSAAVTAAVQRPFEVNPCVECVNGIIVAIIPRAALTAAAATPLAVQVTYSPRETGGVRRRQVTSIFSPAV